MARAVRWGLEVTLLAAVDVEEAVPLPFAPGSPREAVAAGAEDILEACWVATDTDYSSRTFVEGIRELDLHATGRLPKDTVLRFPYTGPNERQPGHRRQFDGRCDRHDLSRTVCTKPVDEDVDLYRGAAPQTTEGVLLYSTDLDLAPERLFRFYGAHFQIEFAFHDAKQHLGLNDGQARLHFHVNIVLAARSDADRNATKFKAGHRIPPQRL
ncbi:MAG: transposase [Caldilineaceae bacterium]|nr:transposase [Caldilineaceae bacterium]